MGLGDDVTVVLATLHNYRRAIALLYETPEGVDEHTLEATGCGDLHKLRGLRAIRLAQDGSYRLDSTFRRFLDRAVRRHRVFGPSQHYGDILRNLELALESYHAALCRGQESDEARAVVFELCDDYCTGMIEEIEHFRTVIGTQANFLGTTIEEKIRYNVNRIARAGFLIDEVAEARKRDFLNEYSDSTIVCDLLRKEFYGRHESIQQRLHECVRDLSANLFDLRRLDMAALRLIHLDNLLSRAGDIELPDWGDEANPPQWTRRFAGMPDFRPLPNPDAIYQDALRELHDGIKDEAPETPKRKQRPNTVADSGAPPSAQRAQSRFTACLDECLDAIVSAGDGQSALDWIEANSVSFPYGPTVWLQMLSSNAGSDEALSSGGFELDYVREERDFELRLLDIIIRVKPSIHA